MNTPPARLAEGEHRKAPSEGMPAGDAAAERTRLLLSAPLVPTLLKMASPNVLSLVAATVVVAWDAWLVGRLGADALAGVALVVPLSMLMVQMSSGAIGGTVAAMVARSLGAGRRDDAERLAQQSLWVALAMAALFGVLVLGFGRALFSAFGGRGAALEAALGYAQVWFAGAAAIWVTNVLAGVVRGSGQMLLPAATIAGIALAHVLLSPLLVFGAGPWAGLGIAGAAASTVACHTVAAVVLAGRLARGGTGVRLHLHGWRPQPQVLRGLLAIGLPTAMSPVLSNASIATATALIASHGTAALAGFGLAARLEYIVLPIAFGFGSALTTLVATNIGAGQRERALRAAWTGAAIVTALSGAIGLFAALAPGWWMGLFTSDPQVHAFGSLYLRIAGSCYGLFGLGLALYFASQGAGRMFWPLVGSVTRLAVVAAGGWVAVKWFHAEVGVLFAVVAAGFVVYAAIIAGAVSLGRWAR